MNFAYKNTVQFINMFFTAWSKYDYGFLCYLEHLLIGRVLATLAAEVFAHALELPAEMDHSLDGRLAPATQLPLGLSRLHLCRATTSLA